MSSLSGSSEPNGVTRPANPIEIELNNYSLNICDFVKGKRLLDPVTGKEEDQIELGCDENLVDKKDSLLPATATPAGNGSGNN